MKISLNRSHSLLIRSAPPAGGWITLSMASHKEGKTRFFLFYPLCDLSQRGSTSEAMSG